MKTQSKVYQLAKKCSQPSFNSPCHTHSLPSYIEEEETISRVFIQRDKQANIFSQTIPSKDRKLDLNNEFNYRYVGLKQLKSYQARGDKKKRNFNSFNKRVSDSAVSFSRISSIKLPQNPYFNKQQLLKQYALRHQGQSQPLQQLYLQDKQFLQTSKSNFSQTITTNAAKSVGQKTSESFSLSKIKTLIQQYEKQWNQSIRIRSIVNKQKMGHKKYRSVLENVVNFRQKIQKRQKYDLIEKNLNQHPNNWGLILHNNKSLQNIHNKQIVKITAKGLKAIGTKKEEKQRAWIDEKDQEGCFFRIPISKESLLNHS